FAVGANAPDETIDFLKFITSLDNQVKMVERGLVTPVIVGADAAVTSEPILQIMEARDNAPYFQLYYDQFLPPAVGGAVNDAVETLFAGTASAEEAAAAIEDTASFELD
ncbi:MAG TPA: hypothetical protein VJZ27_19220, partial [Aggregatilineales bacterium]|nr:hypothetical protein [Aggregatilineales bacterium]